MVTVTAVHPAARFGELMIDGDYVKSFKEKPQVTHGWINGGFFVLSPKTIDLIDGDNTSWEGEPLTELAKMGELMAFEHEGFWQPMDTLRDQIYLQSRFRSRQTVFAFHYIFSNLFQLVFVFECLGPYTSLYVH